ncbi:MAG: hypothetical protein A2218_10470 [Elusimicrobia bacterium RIFOXYA2_FULL_53_38]|nr:MAG: hypothetical protein A2218_10470 [Elusimicrobia bacterium RIFOXYA2_FULL_53_38]
MLKSKIEVGKEYALREPRSSDGNFQRFRVLEHVRGSKWRAEWIEPNPGLKDYVESSALIVRWKDVKAFLRDEDRKRQLLDDNAREGYEKDSPYDKLLYEVFSSIGEADLQYYHGILSGKKDALDRALTRAGIATSENFLYSYTARNGEIQIPYAGALKIAKAFSMKEPATVLTQVEATEREWEQQALRPGKEYLVQLLNEYRASWAILRQWAGYDAAVAQREEYIKRLERLVWDAIYALQKAGADSEATRLRRSMSSRG